MMHAVIGQGSPWTASTVSRAANIPVNVLV
jgi:hypothetical protein